jgi:hypothetical protein
MTLASLKDEIANLSPEDQRRLAAFLVALQRARDESFQQELARKNDDKDPGHWVELAELEKKFHR